MEKKYLKEENVIKYELSNNNNRSDHFLGFLIFLIELTD